MGCVSSTNRHTDVCVGTDDSRDETICINVNSKALKTQYYDQVNKKTSKHTSEGQKHQRNTSVITSSLKSSSSHKSKKSRGFDSKSPTSAKACSHMLNNKFIKSSVRSEISSKMNASAEIIAGPVISSNRCDENLNEFDLEYLEKKEFPSNPYLPLYQEHLHEKACIDAISPQLKSNPDILKHQYSTSL